MYYSQFSSAIYFILFVYLFIPLEIMRIPRYQRISHAITIHYSSVIPTPSTPTAPRARAALHGPTSNPPILLYSQSASHPARMHALTRGPPASTPAPPVP